VLENRIRDLCGALLLFGSLAPAPTLEGAPAGPAPPLPPPSGNVVNVATEPLSQKHETNPLDKSIDMKKRIGQCGRRSVSELSTIRSCDRYVGLMDSTSVI
jgi:hypothetical protein